MKAEWKKVKLGELYEVHNGLSKGGKFFGSGFPFLSFSTIFNNWFIPDTIKDLVQSTEQEQNIFSIKAGDVFVTRTSETANELGMSCVALKDYPNATFNGFCKRLRPKESELVIDSKFVGYYLRTPLFRSKFLGLSGAMTTRASLKNDDLLEMEINIPPLTTQQKIASILSAYDDFIENNRKQINLLEEAAQRLYKEWFVDLRFPGYEDVAIVNGVPEGWRKENIDKVYSIKYGKNLPTSEIQKKGKYPVYGASKMIGYYSQKNCDNYAVLITSRGNAGVVHRTHYQESFITNNSFIVLPQISSLHNVFIFFQMKQLKFESIVTGSCQQQLTNGLISQKKVIVPTNNILTKFNEETDCLFERIEILMKQNEYLAETRDRLLPKLISGELEV